jgi:hypothetical protein
MTGDFPEVRYADSDGVSIAYEVRGNGPLDLVYVPSSVASLMASTVYPLLGQGFDQLASLARLIRLESSRSRGGWTPRTPAAPSPHTSRRSSYRPTTEPKAIACGQR